MTDPNKSMGQKAKDIFKGKDSDADKSEAFTGETKGADAGDTPSGLGDTVQSGENTSSFTGQAGNAEDKLGGGDRGQKDAKAAGLPSAAQSGENTSSFTG